MFDHAEFDAHESVHMFHQPNSDTTVIIAIHDTTFGPALGGVRMMPYPSSEAALYDVLRLAKGMTAKNVLAGVPNGGGKAVIVGDPRSQKTPEILLFYADCVNTLNGRFVSGQDIGVATADVDVIRSRTKHTACASAGGAGNPSPATAYGVFEGIRAALRAASGSADLKGVRFAVQGLGNVGHSLAERLLEQGAKLYVADPDPLAVDRARQLGADALDSKDIHAADVDVFVPCAVGGILNAKTIPQIQAKIVAGAANNQLATPADGERLFERGILYAPDYVINGGGVICIHHEGPTFDRELMMAHVARIGGVLDEIFARAKAERSRPELIADHMVEERISQARLERSVMSTSTFTRTAPASCEPSRKAN